MDEVAIITFEHNIDAARKIQDFTGGDILLYSQNAFRRAFGYRSIIAIMATGIAVRNISPLINNKWKDPAVVVVDSGLNFAIPIIGGHHGGNELAKKLSGLGIAPVITTATEVHGKASVEGLANRLGYRIINKNSTKNVNMALLEKDVEIMQIKGPRIVMVGDDVSVLKRSGLVVGIGTNRGVSSDEVMEAVNDSLSIIGSEIGDVKFFASASIKENEPGIINAAAAFGKEIKFVSHDIINSMQAQTPSKAQALGLNGVCEPAALALSQEKILLLKKRKYANVTIAIAR